MSLYGEYGGIAVLKRALEKEGHAVIVDHSDEGTVPFGDYDMIYAGSGTEEALLEACRRLAPAADSVRENIAAGRTLWIATGNAMALFGKTVIRGEVSLAGAGAFEYTTEMDRKRYLGDVLTTGENIFGGPCVGFVNTSCRFLGMDAPVLEMRLNPTLGNDKASPAEGFLRGNFFGTQLIGNVLVKNPHVMRWTCYRLTGNAPVGRKATYQEEAYGVALRELTARLK